MQVVADALNLLDLELLAVMNPPIRCREMNSDSLQVQCVLLATESPL